MTRKLDWYFDFVSPFAYLQHEGFDRLPADVQVNYRPVLLGGLLSHHEQKGPAEIPSKRVFTYRYAHWLAKHLRIPFRTPPAHPFNPLKVLRLAIAMNDDADIVREIFRFIWRDGRLVQEPAEWQALTTQLGINDADERVEQPEVKAALRKNTEDAIANNVFGVPTFVADGNVFWGTDATGMLLDYLKDPNMFEAQDYARLSELPQAASRKPVVSTGE